MAKANQMSKRKADIAIINEHYDTIIKFLGEYAETTDALMPLLSDVLRLGQKLAKLYKEGFNAGVKYGAN